MYCMQSVVVTGVMQSGTYRWVQFGSAVVIVSLFPFFFVTLQYKCYCSISVQHMRMSLKFILIICSLSCILFGIYKVRSVYLLSEF